MNDKLNSIRHRDKRANIPTNELRGFVEEDEKAPKTMRYPRDPSLDPQLVWKGKDEQDGEDLAVPVAPVYIQEKIHPQAIIEAFRAEVRNDVQPRADLFADFNGIPFADQIEFYRHEQNWSNRMILGDSLLVMTSLAEKEGLKGKGPDDLHGPSLRHQVRLQLAGVDAEDRRWGKRRGRQPRAGGDQGVSRHLGIRRPFLVFHTFVIDSPLRAIC